MERAGETNYPFLSAIIPGEPPDEHSFLDRVERLDRCSLVANRVSETARLGSAMVSRGYQTVVTEGYFAMFLSDVSTVSARD